MRIEYKETAIADILETQQYVSRELHNEEAAKRLTYQIVNAISLLGDNPYMGTPLNAQYDIETDLRYLLVSKRLIFYRVREKHVEVTRVLDGRQDYLAILF
ncbi:MAG: type II toxin-antitoxin system RelE/ParE family toxin [Oscillospiraceae bacterium]